MKGFSPYIDAMIKTFMTLKLQMNIDAVFWQIPGDSFIDRARNTFANLFMESDFTHILYIDSDEAWNGDGLARMILDPGDVIAACYPIKNNWEFYGGNLLVGEDKKIITNDKGMIKAISAPGGFMRVKRSVYDRLAVEYKDNVYFDKDPADKMRMFYDFYGTIMDYENYRVIRDDTAFCYRCQSIGIEIWIEPNVTITHFGNQGYQGNFLNKLKQSQEKKIETIQS